MVCLIRVRTSEWYCNILSQYSSKSCHTNPYHSRMRQLSQIQTNRLKKFSTWDYASALVANWLINNQHLFEQEIFLPPCISVSVPDPKYQSAVEACFNQTQIKVSMFDQIAPILAWPKRAHEDFVVCHNNSLTENLSILS